MDSSFVCLGPLNISVLCLLLHKRFVYMRDQSVKTGCSFEIKVWLSMQQAHGSILYFNSLVSANDHEDQRFSTGAPPNNPSATF